MRLLQRESGVTKFLGTMRSLVNQAESPTLPDGSLESWRLRLGEVLAALNSRERLLGFARRQNPQCVDFLLRRLCLGRVVIGLPLRFLGQMAAFRRSRAAAPSPNFSR